MPLNLRADGDLQEVLSPTGGDFSGKVLLAFHGANWMVGTGSSQPSTGVDDFAGTSLPALVKAALVTQYPNASFTAKNYGVTGQTTADMASNAPNGLDKLVWGGYYDRHILLVSELPNHIVGSDLQPVAALDAWITYCQNRRFRGWKVIGMTIPPRTAALGNVTDYEARRQYVNAFLRQYWFLFMDGLADVGDIAFTTSDGVNPTSYTGFRAATLAELSRMVANGYTLGAVAPSTTTLSSLPLGMDPRAISWSQLGTVISDGGGSYQNDPTRVAAKVFDGDPSTFYDAANGNPGKYVGRDLGVAKTLSRVIITPRPDYQYSLGINNAQMQYSTDGSTWQTVFTVSGVTTANYMQAQIYNFSPVSARYWRLYFPNTNQFGNVAEIQLLQIT